jgi:hypothetical protein
MSRHGSKPWPRPGGISVSRVVRDQVRDKLDLAFEDLGDQQVKNIVLLAGGLRTFSNPLLCFCSGCCSQLKAFFDVLRPRTRARVDRGRARGRKGGRKPKLTKSQICHARKLLADSRGPQDDDSQTMMP